MDVQFNEVEILTPKFGGNRELAPDKQARFHVKPLDFWSFRRVSAQFTKQGHLDEEALTRKLYEECVARVENLTIDGKIISSGAELMQCPRLPNGLLREVSAFLMRVSGLTEDEEKN